jgi:hypothetical protein
MVSPDPFTTYNPSKHRKQKDWSTAIAIQTLLPNPVPVHHLGLFREPVTLQPVEYYNNLPYHVPDHGTPSNSPNTSASEIAFLLDPVIATGGTCSAAIQTLREWGVKKVIVVAVLGAVSGVVKAASEWEEGVEIWIAGIDETLNDRGMIAPGLGDVGDRLFLTIGKWVVERVTNWDPNDLQLVLGSFCIECARRWKLEVYILIIQMKMKIRFQRHNASQWSVEHRNLTS